MGRSLCVRVRVFVVDVKQLARTGGEGRYLPRRSGSGENHRAPSFLALPFAPVSLPANYFCRGRCVPAAPPDVLSVCFMSACVFGRLAAFAADDSDLRSLGSESCQVSKRRHVAARTHPIGPADSAIVLRLRRARECAREASKSVCLFFSCTPARQRSRQRHRSGGAVFRSSDQTSLGTCTTLSRPASGSREQIPKPFLSFFLTLQVRTSS